MLSNGGEGRIILKDRAEINTGEKKYTIWYVLKTQNQGKKQNTEKPAPLVRRPYVT